MYDEIIVVLIGSFILSCFFSQATVTDLAKFLGQSTS